MRAEAARMGLPVAEKPDSQDICFVPTGTYADVVARHRPEALAAGEIVTEAGDVVGTHEGVARYTVGQAKRLGSAGQADGVRRVVVALDAGRKRVVVGDASAGTRLVQVREVNWLIAPGPLRCHVKLRARETPHPATVTPTADGADILLDTPSLPAPGQGCVFYDGDRVLGGGFITRRARRPDAEVAARSMGDRMVDV